MEHDRFQRNQKLFVIGMISLLISLTLFTLTMFVIPNYLFGWRYDTPAFFITIKQWLISSYSYTDTGASRLIVFTLFIISVFFAFIAYYASNSIDNEIYKSKTSAEDIVEKKRETNSEAISLAVRISSMILLIIVVSLLMDWFLSASPIPPEIPSATNAPTPF